MHSNESQPLAEGTGGTRLRRRLSFGLQQALSFRTRHNLCRQGVALAGTRKLRLQGPVSVHAYCTERVTGSEGREGANRVGGGNGHGHGVGGKNGNVNGDGGGDGAGTRTEVEASKRTHDGNGDWSGDGDGARTGTGVETRGRT